MAMAKGNSKKAQKSTKISKKVQNKANNTKSKKECENRVSCLMLTYDRPSQKPVSSIMLFENSVRQFAEQTYKFRELVIVNSGSKQYYEDCESKLYDLAEEYNNFSFNMFYVTRDEYQTIADLRNKAVLEATGDYIMTWDDDDNRSLTIIEKEMDAMKENDADIVMIKNIKVRLGLGKQEFPCNYVVGFEPSMIAKKTDKVLYFGENSDTKYIAELKEKGYKEFVIQDNDCADYMYNYWGTNITNYDKFASIITISQKIGLK